MLHQRRHLCSQNMGISTYHVSGRLYSLAHLKNIEKFATAGLKSVP